MLDGRSGNYNGLVQGGSNADNVLKLDIGNRVLHLNS